MNIKRWIRERLNRIDKDTSINSENGDDSASPSSTTKEGFVFPSKNSIATTLNLKHSNASFENANLGVINFYIQQSPADQNIPTINMPSAPEIDEKMDIALALEKDRKFDDAILQYKQLLEDGAIQINRLSQEQIERICSHLLLFYSYKLDIKSGTAIFEKYTSLGFVKSSLFLYSAFSLFFNGAFYEKAQQMLDIALELYPSEFRFKAYSVINTLMWEGTPNAETYNESFLLKEWKEFASSSDLIEKNELYFVEAQFLLLFTAGKFRETISLYDSITCRKTIIMHTCYIKSLFCDARQIVKVDGKYSERGNVDYIKISQLHAIIVNIESTLKNDERSLFQRAIADVYCNCLILLDKTETIISENLFSQITNDEMKKGIMTSIMLQGRPVDEGTVDEMVTKVEALRSTNKYAKIVDLLWPWICNQSRIDTYFKVNALMAALNAKENELFVEIITWLKSNNEYVDECTIPESVYLYDNNAKQKALSLLQSVFTKSNDPHLLINIISICIQMGEYNLAFDLNNKIQTDKAFVVDICTESFFSLSYQIHAKLQKNIEFVALLALMEHHHYKGKEYHFAQMNLSFFTNDCGARIEAAERLYELTNDTHYLFISTETRLMIYDLRGAAICLEMLKENKETKQSELLMLFSRYYILTSEYDKAQECAQKAKDIEIDHPMSQAHGFYVSVSLRTGHMEGASYLYEYASIYPSDRHKTWYKTITAIVDNESGDKVLSAEANEFFANIAESSKSILSQYRNTEIGIAVTKNSFGWRYNDTMVRLHKLKVFFGSNKALIHETTNDFSALVVDSFFLYWLEKLNMIHLLHNANEIIIPYSVMQALVIDLLHEEDPVISNILDFIKKATNISFVAINAEQKRAFYEERNDFISNMPDVVALIDCALYSAASNKTYLYGDDNGRWISSAFKGKSSCITAFLRHALAMSWITPDQYGVTLLKMSSFKFSFLNIDSLSVIAAFRSLNYDVNEDFTSLIEIKIGSDVISYISVFFEFLLMMREKDSYRKALFAVVRAFDIRYGRTLYHIHIATEYEEAAPYIFIRQVCILGISTALSLVVNDWSEDELMSAISTTCTHIAPPNYKSILSYAREAYAQNASALNGFRGA